MLKFKAYEGSAGPSEDQIRNNTLWVSQVLFQLGVLHKVVPLKSTPNGKYIDPDDDAVTVRVGRYYIDYDRWGFLVTRGTAVVFDQVSDKVLLAWLHKKFKRS